VYTSNDESHVDILVFQREWSDCRDPACYRANSGEFPGMDSLYELKVENYDGGHRVE